MIGELYQQYEYWIAAAQLILAMLGMGATLSVRDFQALAAKPVPVLSGVAMQLTLPAICVLIVFAFAELTPSLMIVMAMIAAIPGGTLSNVLTFISGGNTPLSIAITGLTTLACLATTPIILQVLISDYLPPGLEMPAGQIARDIAFNLLLPLMAGMLIRGFLPDIAAGFSKWCIRASLTVILIIIVGATAADRIDSELFGGDSLRMIFILFVMISAAGYLAPRLCRFSHEDALAVEYEFILRNTSLGILIAASVFPASSADGGDIGAVILMGVLSYGGIQVIIGFAVGSFRAWRLKRASRATVEDSSV